MHNVFLSRGYIIFMYFVFHFDLTFGFHLTQMILLSTLAVGRLFAWPSSLDFWIWRVKVSRACLENCILPGRRPLGGGYASPSKMDPNFRFHNKDFKAVTPLTGK